MTARLNVVVHLNSRNKYLALPAYFCSFLDFPSKSVSENDDVIHKSATRINSAVSSVFRWPIVWSRSRMINWKRQLTAAERSASSRLQRSPEPPKQWHRWADITGRTKQVSGNSEPQRRRLRLDPGAAGRDGRTGLRSVTLFSVLCMSAAPPPLTFASPGTAPVA